MNGTRKRFQLQTKLAVKSPSCREKCPLSIKLQFEDPDKIFSCRLFIQKHVFKSLNNLSKFMLL